MATKAKGKATTKAASKPAKKVPAIPPGYEGVTPYLTVRGAQQALDWARWKNSGRRWSRGGLLYARIAAGSDEDRPQHIVQDFEPTVERLRTLGFIEVWQDRWLWGHEVFQKPRR